MINLDQNTYVFVLGREREIALEELKAVLNRFGFCLPVTGSAGAGFSIHSVSGNLALINIDNAQDSDVAGLISVLAGTVKIFRLVALQTDNRLNRQQTTENNSDGIVELITEIIVDSRTGIIGKLDFGLSDYTNKIGMRRVNTLGIEVKKKLKKRGVSSRFVALREGTDLSSIQTLKNNLDSKGIEVGLFNFSQYCSSDEALEPGTKEGFSTRSGNITLGMLVALNDPEEWGKRDYGKPAGDKRSGMIPPKLARMLINIVLGLRARNPKFDPVIRRVGTSDDSAEILNFKQIQNSKSKSQKVLNLGNSDFNIVSDLDIRNSDFRRCVVIDPFCGSGNILMEAMLLGCDVIGSDISEKAVDDTRANIAWLIQSSNLKFQNETAKSKIFQADATKKDFAEPLVVKRQSLATACIVTEPYLGEPKKFAPTLGAVQGEYARVREIYLGFLKNFSTFAFPLSTLCIVFPLVETSQGEKYSLYQETVDEIRKLGYTELRKPLIYGRDYQVVKREIVFLQIRNSKSEYRNKSK